MQSLKRINKPGLWVGDVAAKTVLLRTISKNRTINTVREFMGQPGLADSIKETRLGILVGLERLNL
jgi:hypothetical protein